MTRRSLGPPGNYGERVRDKDPEKRIPGNIRSGGRVYRPPGTGGGGALNERLGTAMGVMGKFNGTRNRN
jgi:hypothetical protein